MRLLHKGETPALRALSYEAPGTRSLSGGVSALIWDTRPGRLLQIAALFVQLVLIPRCIRRHVPLFKSCDDYILSWRWASKLKSLCSSEMGCSQRDKILFSSLVTFLKMCMRKLRVPALTEICLHGCQGVVGRPREHLRFTEKRPSWITTGRGRTRETHTRGLPLAERKAGAAVPVPKTLCGFYTLQLAPWMQKQSLEQELLSGRLKCGLTLVMV